MTAVRTVVVVGGALALVGMVAVTAVVARGTPGDDTANGWLPVRDLEEVAGSYVAVNDTTTPATLQGTVRLRFDGDRVVAETGCNTARGPVSVEGSVLVAGALMTTRMACEPALMEQERWVTEMLTSRPRLERSGPYLALHWGEHERWWLGLEQEGRAEEPASTP